MDLRQVRYFLAVAQHLHFCRAARRLKISQPTLSQQIRALEKRVGAELFIRHPKGIGLSPAGSAFLHKAQLAVSEADGAIQDALDAKNGVTGHVKILCSPLAEYTLLKDVLRMMRQSCPALIMEVHFSSGTNHLSSVADGTFSASFMSCHSALSNPVLLCETLYHEECVVMLPESHPLARSRSLSLHQLAQETWIVTELSDAILQNTPFSSGCDGAGFDPKWIRPAEWHSLFPLVASGAGISLVPAALQLIRRPDLRFVPLADGLQIPVNVITRANDPSPHVLQFRQCAAQAFAMRPGSNITKVPRFPARRATSSRNHARTVRIPRRVGVRISSTVTQFSKSHVAAGTVSPLGHVG
jgi:DNA-binding transcriptional LysR family regulator